MDTIFKPIDHAALWALLAANKSQRVQAFALKEGWYLVVRRGKTAKALAAEDGGLRLFTTLNELDDYLREHRRSYFVVDTSELDKTADDPGTFERLREAQQAEEYLAALGVDVLGEDIDGKEYDEWMRHQIQEALDDPRPSIPNAEVKERATVRRAELLARLAQDKP
jgi:hypothetical protein